MGLIAVGIVLLVLGFLLGLGILWVLGLVALVVGLILLFVPAVSGGIWYGRYR